MAEIKLKAVLRAYSKSPFYEDTVRDVYSQAEVTPGIQYVRVYNESLDENGNPISGEYKGEWVQLDTTLLEKPLEEYNQQVVDLKKSLAKIYAGIDKSNNQLVFIDNQGNKYYSPLPQANVDLTTLNLNDNFALYVIDTPDQETLKETDNIYRYGVDSNGVPIPDPDTGIIEKISGKLRVEGIYVNDTKAIISGDELNFRLSKAEKNIKDLESYTQGTGGFLDPINFNKALSKLTQQERDNLLNKEAYNQLSNGNAQLIPDQTKIKNLFDGHIWVYIQEKDTWVDDGADTVVQANNEGVLGVVTGSNEKFKASIDNNGIISINGLVDALSDTATEDSFSVEPEVSTNVRRSETGQIKATDPKDLDDVTTLGYLETFYASNKITDEQIDSLFGGNN